jgi:hypothetical protein
LDIEEPRPPKKPRRWLRWPIIIVMLWCGWAAYAVIDLAGAVDSEDTVALERRIDWVAVRDDLREDLRSALTSGRGAAAASNEAIEALDNPSAVAALIRAARFTDRGRLRDAQIGSDWSPWSATASCSAGIELMGHEHGGRFAPRLPRLPSEARASTTAPPADRTAHQRSDWTRRPPPHRSGQPAP